MNKSWSNTLTGVLTPYLAFPSLTIVAALLFSAGFPAASVNVSCAPPSPANPFAARPFLCSPARLHGRWYRRGGAAAVQSQQRNNPAPCNLTIFLLRGLP